MLPRRPPFSLQHRLVSNALHSLAKTRSSEKDPRRKNGNPRESPLLSSPFLFSRIARVATLSRNRVPTPVIVIAARLGRPSRVRVYRTSPAGGCRRKLKKKNRERGREREKSREGQTNEMREGEEKRVADTGLQEEDASGDSSESPGTFSSSK